MRTVLLLLSASVAFTISAASYSVRGRIVAADGNQTCPGATYRIFAASDTIRPIAVDAGDTDGAFMRRIASPGSYILKAEYVGLKPASRRFSVSAKAPVADLGTIALTADQAMLGEVVVTGQRKLVESDGATLTYNVDEDPASTTSSVIEMLRKVPMVSVDAEDNIKVKGQSNFKIYLNGKEDPMLSGDPKTILKSMPAASIKKIEVITEPGAKYDAEGTAGILNIVTVGKQSLEGYMANIQIWHNISNSGISGYGRTKVRNVTASLRANYNDSRIYRPRHTYSSETYDNLLSETDRTQRERSVSTSRWNYVGANFSLSWEPDTLNLFTASADFGHNLTWNDTRNVFSMTFADGSPRWNYIRDWSGHGSYMGVTANASYQHTFRRQGHFLVVSYLFSNNTNDNTSEQHRHSFEGTGLTLPWIWGKNNVDNLTDRHVIQIDYTNPFSQKHTLEAGAKAQLQRSQGNAFPLYGMTYEDMRQADDEHVKMEQYQDILALYASYSGTFGKFSGRAGLRWEYTHTGIDYRIAPKGYSDFTTVLNDLVPNASMTWRFTSAANLRLAYQMRISRPGIWQLNPYRNEMTTNRVNYGNPDLESAKSNQVSLTYSNYGGKIGGNVGVSYAYTKNSVENYTFLGSDGRFYSTYANIGRYQWVNLNGYIQWTIITDMQFSLYGGLNYEDYRADSPELSTAKAGWSGHFNASFDYTLPCKLRLSAFGGAGTKWIMLQSEGSGWSYYGLQISRSFLKNDALTINAYIQNFIKPRRISTSYTEAPGMRSSSYYDFSSIHFGLGLSFRFGSLQSDVKRTNASIESDSGQQGPSKGK